MLSESVLFTRDYIDFYSWAFFCVRCLHAVATFCGTVLRRLAPLRAVSLVLSVSASVARCSFCFARGFALTERGTVLRRLGHLRAVSLVLSVSASVAFCSFLLFDLDFSSRVLFPCFCILCFDDFN
jgi:hypothetical protein